VQRVAPRSDSGSNPSLAQGGDEPYRRGPPDSEREQGEERRGTGWAVGPGKEKWSRLGRLASKKRKGWLGWASWEERERGAKEREIGPGQKEKEREKNSNGRQAIEQCNEA
jgi:hypothetical protein